MKCAILNKLAWPCVHKVHFTHCFKRTSEFWQTAEGAGESHHHDDIGVSPSWSHDPHVYSPAWGGDGGGGGEGKEAGIAAGWECVLNSESLTHYDSPRTPRRKPPLSTKWHTQAATTNEQIIHHCQPHSALLGHGGGIHTGTRRCALAPNPTTDGHGWDCVWLPCVLWALQT